MMNVQNVNDELDNHQAMEYKLLSYLAQNELTSQRKMAGATGLSLPMVNIMLKRMAKKGLVKMDRLNARAVRYILTPKGLQQKAGHTYRYLCRSYSYIKSISNYFEDLVNEFKSRNINLDHVYLFGPKDEIFEIIRYVLSDHDIKGISVKKLEQLPEDPALVIVWRDKYEAMLPEGYPFFNPVKDL